MLGSNVLLRELDSELVKSSAVILDSKKALETGEFDFENRKQSVVGNLGQFVSHSQNVDSRVTWI